MKRRYKVHRWFKRVARRPHRRLKVIEEVIVSDETMDSFSIKAKVKKVDSKILIRTGLQGAHQDKASSVTFETLPLEIRYLIYSFILPQRQRLIYLTGEDESAPTFLPLLKTCYGINSEVTRWFNGVRENGVRYETTLEYGLLDISNTHFALTIDDTFRDREICEIDESQGLHVLNPICKCCTKFDQVFHHADWTVITSFALHFKTADTPGRRDNLNAVKAMCSLENLQSLDILLGDIGGRWDYNKEQWQKDDPGDGHFWIPTNRQSCVALISHDNGILPFVIRVWMVVQGEGGKDRVELLVSYNEEAVERSRSRFPIADLV